VTGEVEWRVICVKMDMKLSMWISCSDTDLAVKRSRRSVVRCSAEEDKEGKRGK